METLALKLLIFFCITGVMSGVVFARIMNKMDPWSIVSWQRTNSVFKQENNFMLDVAMVVVIVSIIGALASLITLIVVS